MKHVSFLLFIALSLHSCSNSQQKNEQILKKVSSYSDEKIIAVSYFNPDTNWTEIAAELIKERNQLLAGKDSSILYYLIVFNKLKFTPDITSDYNIMWSNDYNNYRTCGLDNGLGFTRFCYGIRLDMGRIGDWQHFRYVQPDGSLLDPDSVYQ